jgi:hypothetical protein
MAEQAASFRDFGILPLGLKPPAGTVRSYLSTGRVIGQWISTGSVATLGVGFMLLFALTLPMLLGLLAALAALAGFAAFVHLATHNDYRWIELEGNTLRARRLYTGRTVERSIEEIDNVGTMVYQVVNATTRILTANAWPIYGWPWKSAASPLLCRKVLRILADYAGRSVAEPHLQADLAPIDQLPGEPKPADSPYSPAKTQREADRLFPLTLPHGGDSPRESAQPPRPNVALTVPHRAAAPFC